MSVNLSPTDRERLAKFLNLLSSDQIGERAEAGAQAHRLITARRLTWDEILAPPPQPQQLPELGTWRETCRKLAACPNSLNQWEKTFISDLPKFQRLSTKQRYILKTIADRVLGTGRNQ